MSERGAHQFAKEKPGWSRVLLLIAILVAIVSGVLALTVHFLYSTAVAEERERLLETARSQARLIEAVARYDARMLGSDEAAMASTLSQISDAHGQYEGFGETGEFTLARLEDGQIVFLLRHRHTDLATPQPVPFDALNAEPMRRALQGASGTLVGLDYRGVLVLAAHEPVAELNLGIVAKIDFSEIRAPFVRAGLLGVGSAAAAILLGAWIFVRVTQPIVQRVGETQQRYRDLVETMSDGLAIQDDVGRRTYVNDRFCEIVGRTREELIGHRTDEHLTLESRAEFARQMEQRVHGSTESYPVTFERPDGSLVDVLLSPRPIFDERGRLVASFVVASDITPLKRVEADLRREKEQAQTYLDLAGTMFVLLTREGRIGLINRRGLEILGYERPEELIGKDWFETCLPEAERGQTRELFQKFLRGEFESSGYNENAVLTRRGKERMVAWHSAGIESETGEIEVVLASGEDISERRRAEERFRVAAEMASDLIFEWDPRLNKLRWYGDIDATLGYGPGTTAATIEAWIALVHPEDADRVTDGIAGRHEHPEPYAEEYRIRHADGSWRHWLERGGAVFDQSGQVVRWIGACVDITDLRRNEAALTRRATQLQIVRDLGQRMSSILDMDALFATVTRMLQERFGFYHVDLFAVDEAREYVVFQSGSNGAINATWCERGLRFAIGHEGVIGAAAGSGVPLLVNDVRKEPRFLPDDLLPDTKAELAVPVVYEGEVLAVLDIQSNERDAFGPEDLELVGALSAQLGIAIMNARLYAEAQRELADRVKAERALRRSEQQYRSLFDNAVLGIYQTTPDGRILVANPALIRMLGYDSFEELARRDLESEGYHPEYPRAVFKERIAREGKVSGLVSAWVRADGEALRLRENARAIRDEHGRVLYYEGTIEDITEQWETERAKEALEAQLIHNQKLESIGTLASGVAHEINNPLTGIINYAQIIEDRVTDEALLGFAGGIIREGQRVAGIVKNLLSFSRQDKERHSPAVIADIVDVVISLVGAVLRRDQIDVRIDIPEGLPRIKCRSQQIEQVLLNLVTNARDALNARYPGYDENKILSLSASLHDEDGKRRIRLTVEDHGEGIPDAIVDRVFDPFFTTKPRDEGTGLGLSISHGIVRDHGGTLSVEREPGATCFRLDLPLSNGWTTPTVAMRDGQPRGEGL